MSELALRRSGRGAVVLVVALWHFARGSALSRTLDITRVASLSLAYS